MISEIVMLDLDRPFLRVLSSLLKQAIIKISAVAEFNSDGLRMFENECHPHFDHKCLN